MARDTFGDLMAAVRVNVGTHALWTDAAATTILTKVQKELTEAYQWTYRKRVALMQMVAPYAVGTVTVTQGSPTVIGSGTAWTKNMTGYAITLPGEVQYFFIRQVLGPTQLILGDYSGVEIPWVMPTAAGGQYVIFPIQYPLPDWVDILLLPTQDWTIEERTVELFDRVDPLRQTTGRPIYYAISEGRVIGPGFTAAITAASGPDTLGTNTGQEFRTIEFWPIPDAPYTMRFPYLRRAIQAPGPNDIPLLPTELVEYAGTIRALRYLHVKTGDDRYLRQLDTWQRVFDGELLPKCIMEDQARWGLPSAMSAGEVVIGNDQYASRDWDIL